MSGSKSCSPLGQLAGCNRQGCCMGVGPKDLSDMGPHVLYVCREGVGLGPDKILFLRAQNPWRTGVGSAWGKSLVQVCYLWGYLFSKQILTNKLTNPNPPNNSIIIMIREKLFCIIKQREEVINFTLEFPRNDNLTAVPLKKFFLGDMSPLRLRVKRAAGVEGSMPLHRPLLPPSEIQACRHKGLPLEFTTIPLHQGSAPHGL